MHAVYKNFAVYNRAPCVLQIDPALSYGFDLCPEKLDACLIAFLDKIVVEGFFIGNNRF